MHDKEWEFSPFLFFLVTVLAVAEHSSVGNTHNLSHVYANHTETAPAPDSSKFRTTQR